MWLVAEYQPVTLFSFRSGTSTSSGAKTLFSPTPFAIRTALLDAAIRTRGVEDGRAAFEYIKNIRIALRLPERVVVTNLFAKVLKPTRKKKEEPEEPMDRSIAFREYAYLDGNLALAFETTKERAGDLRLLLAQVNYFGKRGSFFQLLRSPELMDALPEDFMRLDEVESTFVLGSIIQVMDDWGDSMNFAKVNIYSDEKIRLGEDRVQKHLVLPYRLVRASKGFSYYERI
ncbi:MAG TPA: hypothetical protein PK659_08945 [Methanothrix sp.]|nr:hypothetical protein [Methanothrix sp.]HOK59018.1 hypothetical protein [Methanothrix sp.]HOL44363.1 hypothetical protein [Methanothrix sp.]HPO89279.1 hypothetical protein [Methanothrix sp.]